VKAFVSQAQLQASLSRSNSPLGASLAAQQSVKSAIAGAAAAAANNSSAATSQTSQQVITAAGGLPQTTVQLHASTVCMRPRYVVFFLFFFHFQRRVLSINFEPRGANFNKLATFY